MKPNESLVGCMPNPIGRALFLVVFIVGKASRLRLLPYFFPFTYNGNLTAQYPRQKPRHPRSGETGQISDIRFKKPCVDGRF